MAAMVGLTGIMLVLWEKCPKIDGAYGPNWLKWGNKKPRSLENVIGVFTLLCVTG